MGLDMYLTQQIYVGAEYDHRKVKLHIDLSIADKTITVDCNKVNEIILNVGYWRKANHIHKWFVDHVQNGVDDCNKYWVSKDNLKELHQTCLQVMEDHSKAADLLPTESGFFFGGTEYDDYYFEDVKTTIDIIEPLLDCRDSIHYQSSW